MFGVDGFAGVVIDFIARGLVVFALCMTVWAYVSKKSMKQTLRKYGAETALATVFGLLLAMLFPLLWALLIYAIAASIYVLSWIIILRRRNRRRHFTPQ